MVKIVSDAVIEDIANDDIANDDMAEDKDDEDASPNDARARKKMAKRSKVWDQFAVIDSEEKGVKPRAICTHCRVASYLADSHNGTSNMINHLKRCSPYIALQAKTAGEPVIFDQMVYRDLVARAIIRHGYAFSWVEHEGNRNIHAYLNNQVRSFTRNTAKSDCLALHEKLKFELKQDLRSIPGRICLTSDMWTSCQTLGYMCLTAHYVDSNWILQSKVLNFVHLETGHSGYLMFSAMFGLLKEWGIEKKIFSITLDNASSNDKMQDYLRDKLNRTDSLLLGGEFFHIRCAAHVLNLIVKDGLELIEHCVVKIRESVKYVKWSESRKRTFQTSVKNANINESKSLWLDVATRWNSTYYMLDRDLLYRDAFVDLGSSNSAYKHLPSEMEWEMVIGLRDLLEPLSAITDLFSGREYPTANLYFENVWSIAMLLKELERSDDLDIRNMAIKMKDKFDKYWFTSVGQEYNTLFAFALILDPRRKKQYLKFCFQKLYEDEKVAVMKLNDVMYKLEKMFEEYLLPDMEIPDAPDGGKSTSKSCTTQSKSKKKVSKSTAANSSNRKRKFQFDDVVIENSFENGCKKTKLETYLEEPLFSNDPDTPFNVLNFWKENATTYGELSHLARDVMTVPLTTVASESTFSIGGRVLDKWKSTILPENLEALITSRSWLYGYADVENADAIGSNVNWNI